MKSESQHLDFLVSQYVDGCLDGANKKSVEQQLLTDPGARKMYDEHREVQDLLDDWGNRIPLINWDEFDQNLAGRLATENVGSSRYAFFRRWAKPVAAAAALFIAASMGYSWHAWWGPHQAVKQETQRSVAELPVMKVTIPSLQGSTQPSSRGMYIDEPEAQGVAGGVNPRHVTFNMPGDAAAKEALLESVAAGTVGDAGDSPRQLQKVPQGSVGLRIVPPDEEKPEVIYP